ncbi:MAG: glycoside hydrolase family 88 protein, partial [Rhodothermales bacterium]
VHHNIYALHKSRNPRPKDVLLDFRNNLVYGFGDRAGYNVDDFTRMNYVGNYVHPLDYSNNADYAFIVGGTDTRMFLADNVLRRGGELIRDDWTMIRPPDGLPASEAQDVLGVSGPFPAPAVTMHSAEEAFDLLVEGAGATRPARDAVDQRIIDLVRSGGGRIIDSQREVGGWPALAEGEVPSDGDADGMPDRWERTHGLDPDDGSDHRSDLDGDGYTNLEEYLNETDPQEPSATAGRAQGDNSPLEWSIRTAESVMERNPVFMDRWHYEVGVMMKAFDDLYSHTGERRYTEFVRTTIDRFVEEDGSIRTYDLTDYNLDQVNAGKLLFPLLERTGDGRYRRAADTLRRQLREHPRTSEGGFWHKKVYPYQLWLDGVYMAGPFLAEYARRFDDEEALEEVTREILLVARYLRDPKTGLYFHGWDEKREQVWADSASGLSRNFWGRGMGWFGMALVDVLDHLPENHPDRGEIVRILQRFASTVAGVQDPLTGLWYQILDKPSRPGNYHEASASVMFVYTFAKGAREGYLDPEYLDLALRGYDGVLKEFVRTNDQGLVDLHGTVSVGGLGGKNQRDGSFAYYMSEPLRINDNKGVGPFIMAGLELAKATSKQTN